MAYRSVHIGMVFALLLVGGCGSRNPSVSGLVTLDGEPLAASQTRQVTIMFYPESGSGAPAAAVVDGRGRYNLTTGSQRGLPAGNYVVTLSAAEYTENPGGGPPKKQQLTPLRYANPKLSGLRKEVVPGHNTIDLALESSESASPLQ